MSFWEYFYSTSKLNENAAKHQYSGLFIKLILSMVLTVTLLTAFNLKAHADDIAAVNLAKLENKFFQHDYPKDTNAERLNRLEKMVFGETKTGSDDDRLKVLLGAVPNLNTSESDQTTKEATSEENTKPKGKSETARSESDETSQKDASKYPAVTAIETQLFGKDYADEPVSKRLDRLETKVFGKASDITDLSERVDRIKERTGVDITKQVPPGSDWVDDDDDQMPLTRNEPALGGRPGAASDQDDLSQNDYRTGRYGFNQQGSTLSPSAPSTNMGRFAPHAVSPTNLSGMGLSQQVSALEMEIFGKIAKHDPLTARVGRLEAAVFPNEKSEVDKPLPDRVNRLLGAVPISSKNIVANNGKQRKSNNDFGDLDPMDPNSLMSTNTRSGGGLSKLFGFFSGGSMGGFPMTNTNGLITDPSSGLLYNQSTGSLIDPSTGAVVGQRMIPSTMQMPMGSMYPYGSQYGGSGLRFGFGGGRIGGLWP